MLNFTKNQKPPLTLQTPVRYLTGVGPKKAQLLAHLGIDTVADLLWKTPRNWEDRRPAALAALNNFMSNDEGGRSAPHAPKKALLCRVEKIFEMVSPQKNFVFFKVVALPGENPSLSARPIYLTWIRRRAPYDVFQKLRRELTAGRKLLAYGRMEDARSRMELYVEDYHVLDNGFLPEESPHWLRLAPQYPATQGISQKQLRELRWNTRHILKEAPMPWDWNCLPPNEITNELLNLGNAYHDTHFPPDDHTLALALKTLACWEFLVMAIAMEWRRHKTLQIKKPLTYGKALTGYPTSFHKVLAHIGVVPTKDQHGAIEEILADMRQPWPMNRLLQGEVGSGKTLVAIAAICQALDAGYQAAFIAPTEILVFQHMATLQKYLQPLDARLGCLTSETSASQRQTLAAQTASGEIRVVAGTHALLDPEIRFQNLAIVVIDEQQRFGVAQRWEMRSKASRPDNLILTATPIPRTLALALYGDLDISTIEELPSGHQIAQTILLEKEAQAWTLIRERVGAGGQAYIVVPAIDASTDPTHADGFNLAQEYQRIRKIFPDYSIATLHGRMPAKEKEQTMQEFVSGKHRLLLATTVIEVGIDVAAADLIVILGAERFGLATLHQLRGRVGRGAAQGLCALVPSPNFAVKETPAFEPHQTIERLKRFCQAKSGFEIGRLDLEWRGHGELLGVAQHGRPPMEHFNFQKHAALIAPLKEVARQVVRKDAQLHNFPYLKSIIVRKFGLDLKSSDIS